MTTNRGARQWREAVSAHQAKKGQDEYGDWVPETDTKDRLVEAMEEINDAKVYLIQDDDKTQLALAAVYQEWGSIPPGDQAEIQALEHKLKGQVEHLRSDMESAFFKLVKAQESRDKLLRVMDRYVPVPRNEQEY